MKGLISWVVLWLGFGSVALAYPILDGSSSWEEKQAFARKLGAAQTGEAGFKLAEEAFARKDAQLLKMCIEHPRTSTWLYERLEKERSSDLGVELAILFLRTIREGEGSPEELAQLSRGVPVTLYICLDIAAEVLPEEGWKKNDPEEIEALRKSSYRFAMAAKLEEYLRTKAEAKAAPEPATPEGSAKPDQEEPSFRSEGSVGTSADVPIVSPPEDVSRKHYWLSGGIIAIIGLCLFGVVKHRR